MNLWDSQYQQLGFRAQRLYPNEELLRFLGGFYFGIPRSIRRSVRILEIGCGSGANLWVLAKEGFAAFGIDISREGLKLCSQRLKKWNVHASICRCDVLKLPYKDNFFDAVVDIVTLQHVTFTDHLTAYKEVSRVLKPSGLFFSYHLGHKSFSYRHSQGNIIDKYTVDNVNNPEAPLNNNGVTCFPSEKAVEQLLSKSAFTNIVIENVIKTYNNRNIKIQYLVVRAQKP